MNPTLYFIFLQWGSHSFIQIPKVDIICSKCFQRQSAASTYILSRVGRKLWNLLNTNREVTEGEGWWRRAVRGENEEKEGGEGKKGIKVYADDLFAYIVTVMTPWTALERLYLLPAAYFHWQGSSQFLAWYYVAEYDWEIGHKIIYLLQVCHCDFLQGSSTYKSLCVVCLFCLVEVFAELLTSHCAGLEVWTDVTRANKGKNAAIYLPFKHLHKPQGCWMSASKMQCGLELPRSTGKVCGVLPALPLALCVALDNSFNPQLPQPIKQER